MPWMLAVIQYTVSSLGKKYVLHGLYRGAKPNKICFSPPSTDISQYRLRFGSSLLYECMFHLNCLTGQLSYEGRAAVEGGK
jgi:hypothetical protein